MKFIRDLLYIVMKLRTALLSLGKSMDDVSMPNVLEFSHLMQIE